MQRYAAGDFDEAEAELEGPRPSPSSEFGADSERVAEIDVNLGWLALEAGDAEGAERRFRSALERIEARLGDLAPPLCRGPRLPRPGPRRVGSGRRGPRRPGPGRRPPPRGDGADAPLVALGARPAGLRPVAAGPPRGQGAGRGRSTPSWPSPRSSACPSRRPVCPAARLEGGRRPARHAAARGTSRTTRRSAHWPDRREQVLRTLRVAARSGPTVGPRRSRSGSRADRAGPDREDRLDELAAEAQDLERQLRARSPRFVAATAADEPPAIDEVVAALPEGSALLDVIELLEFRRRRPGEPLVEARRYVGFLVRPDGPIDRVDLGDAEAVDRAATAFLRDLTFGSETAEPGAALAALVRDPLLPMLDGVELLVVSADGLLQQVPLAALPGAGARHLLGRGTGLRLDPDGPHPGPRSRPPTARAAVGRRPGRRRPRLRPALGPLPAAGGDRGRGRGRRRAIRRAMPAAPVDG